MQRITIISLAKRGGTVLYASELATELSRHFDVLYVGAQQAEARPASVRSTLYDLGASHAGVVSSAARGVWLRMRSDIAAWRPRAILFPLTHPFNPILSALFHGVPQATTIHDVDAHPGAQLPALTRFTHHWAIRHSKAIVVLSEHGSDVVRHRLRAGQILRMIPHPIFRAYCEEQPRPAANSQPILFIGRWEPYKGLETLARAAAELLRMGSPVRLVVAGAGRLPAGAGQLSTLPNVALINRYLPAAEVGGLVRESRALVLPYTSATQSGVAGIAYAALKPVVASAVGGLKEQVADGTTGMLVPPGDPAALAAALDRMWNLDPGVYGQFQTRMLVRRESDLNPAAIARQYASLLLRIM
ncbi:MAG: glycosyltransferase [Bryobacteraceae bacterium]|jgi:glycosyltransferase involved in cell wall biosynthesis